MMTCVSPRSGMASSGTRWSDQAPASAAAPTSSRTRNLFVTEKSRMRWIIDRLLRRVLRRVRVELPLAVVGAEEVLDPLVGAPASGAPCAVAIHLHATSRIDFGMDDTGRGGLHAALGIEQEIGCTDHAFAFHQPAGDFDPVTEAPAGLDAPGLEVSLAAIDEDRLAQ